MAKKREDYDAIASQIGDLGGEPTNKEEGLGKLVHKKSYGQREDLTTEEKAAEESFLQRSNARRLTLEDRYDEQDTPIADGWIPLSREEFGIRGQFYPEGWDFYIRPATPQAIKGWLSIDEKRAWELNQTFDEIIKLCVKIKSGESTISWRNINSWDRFWLILKVREATFASNKKTITFEDSCSECGSEMTFELRANTLHYEFPDDELINKYWNPEDMVWDIDPAEYGVKDHDIVTLHTPTLIIQQTILDWAQRMRGRGKKIDETFAATFLPWLLGKVGKDDNIIDRQIQKLEKEYRSWSVAMHAFMTDVVRNITINPFETLKQTCPHCGEEVVSNVQFPDGIKILFDTETGIQKFGSR